MAARKLQDPVRIFGGNINGKPLERTLVAAISTENAYSLCPSNYKEKFSCFQCSRI